MIFSKTPATVKTKQTTMAQELATTTSMAGCMIHDLVDLIQEKILKNRKSRNEEHWRTLKVSEFSAVISCVSAPSSHAGLFI
jgi:hypothetical protein